MYRSPYATRPPELPTHGPGYAFDLYFQIAPVVLIYGNRRRLHADEHNHGGRLMRTLDWLGREGLPLRCVFRADAALDLSSVRALNCYLQHGPGLAAFRRVASWQSVHHRYAWHELQRLLNLRWR